MELTVLGCSGPFPKANGATSGYLLKNGEQRLLIDCGSAVLSRLLALFDPACLSGVLLSHLHFDHMCDMLPMRYYLESRGATLPVFCPEKALGEAKKIFETPAYDVRAFSDHLSIAGLRVTAIPARHPVPTCALRFEAMGKVIVYTGDVNWTDALVPFCEGADALLADAAFLNEQWNDKKPHMSARLAAELARRAGCGRLILTHRVPGTCEEALLDEARAVFKQVCLAQEGMRITV